jgi:Zn-dependent membrane protease YugP
MPYGYHYGYYGFGYLSYLMWMLPALAVVLIAQIMVKSRYSKYSRINNGRNITGQMAAETILRANGVSGVRIMPIQGKLTDNFNPRDNTIYLSQDIFYGTSIAAVGIASHEAGHAVQYAMGYAPMKLRHAIIPVSNICSQAGYIIIIIGAILSMARLMMIGIILYSFIVLVQLVTLPVELNASRRALQGIKSTYMLEGADFKGAKKMLTAAALTYVGALLTSLFQVLWFLLRASGRRK